MTQDELIDLGKLIAAIREMQLKLDRVELRLKDGDRVISSHTKENHHLATEVMRLRQVVKRIPCLSKFQGSDEERTDPDCPAVLSDAPPSYRERLLSVDDEGPDSALTRPMEFRASKSGFSTRGPSIMVVVLGSIVSALVTAGLVAWVWLRHRVTG